MQNDKRQNSFYLLTDLPDSGCEGFDWEKYNLLFKHYNVIIKVTANNVYYPEHCGCLSVKTVMTGVESYYIGNNEYKIREDTYLLLNRDQFYANSVAAEITETFSISFTEEFEHHLLLNIIKSSEFLLDYPFETHDQHVQFTNTIQHFSETMKAIVHAIYLQSEQTIANAGALEEKFYMLYSELIAQEIRLKAGASKLECKRYSTRMELFRRVTLAKDYIESNYNNQTISLKEIARHAYLNEFHLIRSFRQIHKCTPYQYLKELRLQRALQLISARKYSISEVMQQCGYVDASSFTKTFKKKFGYPPLKIIR
jgi:AraC family transcriptional regulator